VQVAIDFLGPHAKVLRLIRDRDRNPWAAFDRRVSNLGIEQLRVAAGSPWASGSVSAVFAALRLPHLTHSSCRKKRGGKARRGVLRRVRNRLALRLRLMQTLRLGRGGATRGLGDHTNPEP